MDMAFKFPYFRPSDELPAALPTISQIRTSKEILKGAEAHAARKVVGVGGHFIVKYSRHNDQIEGQNLFFFKRNNIKGVVPRFYAMWKEPDDTLVVVMERPPGVTLESLWSSLAKNDKDKILLHTRFIMEKVRAISPPDFFGSVDRKHMPHYLFYWPKYPANISGPYASERDLIQGLVLKSRANAQDNGREAYLADFFEKQLLGALAKGDRSPVFTHSDLQRKNVLVDEISGSHDDEKEFRVSLVDWESAGWYPVYWEYFAAFLAFQWDDDWCSEITQVIEAWPAETAMLKMIHQDLWM
jgi:hypothetical protein